MLNKVMIIGRLGRDPEVRYTQSGKAVANFSVATDHGPRDNKKTEWHRIVVWDKLAELCGRYLAKGRQVYVEGRLQTRDWEKEGVKRSSTEIVANQVTFLGSNDGAGQQSGQGGGYGRQTGGYGNQGGGYGRQTGGYGNQAGGPPPQGDPDVVPYADDDDIPF